MDFKSVTLHNKLYNYKPIDIQLYLKKWLDLVKTANNIISCLDEKESFIKFYFDFSKTLLDLNLTEYALEFMGKSRIFIQDEKESNQKELSMIIENFSKECKEFIHKEKNRLISNK